MTRGTGLLHDPVGRWGVALAGGAVLVVLAVAVALVEAARHGHMAPAVVVAATAGIAAIAVAAARGRVRDRESAAGDLAREAARVHALIAAIPDVELWVGPDDTIIGGKPGHLAGVEVGALSGAPIGGLRAPAGPALLDAIRRAREAGASEASFRCCDGRHLEIRCAAAGDEVAVLVRDVTRQVLAEQALRASEERFRLIAEHTGDFVLRCTPEAHRVRLAVGAGDPRMGAGAAPRS